MPKDVTNSGIPYFWDANFDEKTGKWSYHETHDFAPIINANMLEQQSGLNGWTPERTMRKVGRIPIELYNDPDFKNLTCDEQQIFLRWFLNKHPEWRTVDKMKHVGANDGHVIIR